MIYRSMQIWSTWLSFFWNFKMVSIGTYHHEKNYLKMRRRCWKSLLWCNNFSLSGVVGLCIFQLVWARIKCDRVFCENVNVGISGNMVSFMDNRANSQLLSVWKGLLNVLCWSGALKSTEIGTPAEYQNIGHIIHDSRS